MEASVVDAEHSTEELSFSWQTFLHHNTHFHPEPADTNATTNTLISPFGCDFETYFYRIALTVTDPAGLSSYKEAFIYPYCGPELAITDSLQATANSNSIQLAWTAIEEVNIAQYTIERSEDDTHFSPIGSVSARGSGSLYEFIDPTPLEADNVYRLRYVTSAGTYDYSPIVQVSFPGLPSSNFLIYPNPAQDQLTVELRALEGEATLSLHNLLGQNIKSFRWENSHAGPSKEVFSLSDVSPGVYIYRLQTETVNEEGLFWRVE